ncbi:MAG TPA: fasciclin domain-containing protein [Ilumatobacteraceae bacterium]
MPAPASSSTRRYRRRILTWGAVAALVLIVVGSFWYVDAVESDLESRVPDELADDGFDGITAEFDGQDGVLTCEAALDDPEAALAAAGDVWGVREIELDRSCRVGSSSTTTTTAPSTTDASTTSTVSESTSVTGFANVVEALAGDPQFSIVSSLVTEAGLDQQLATGGPYTVFAPTDAAFESLPADVLAALRQDLDLLANAVLHHVVAGELPLDQLASGTVVALDGGDLTITRTDAAIMVDDATVIDGDIDAGNGVVHVVDAPLLPDDAQATLDTVLSAHLEGGRLTLTGAVANASQHSAISQAAASALDPVSISDQITVDAASPTTVEQAVAIARIVPTMPFALASGTLSLTDGGVISVSGVEVDATALRAAAGEVGATVELTPRPTATQAEVDAVEADLGAAMAADPIVFDTGESEILASMNPTLDVLAAVAKQYAGQIVTVTGHTDTDGDEADNQTLSEERAASIAAALVARGVPSAEIRSAGAGETQPIIVGGVEDKEASRRIVFDVELAPAG